MFCLMLRMHITATTEGTIDFHPPSRLLPALRVFRLDGAESRML